MPSTSRRATPGEQREGHALLGTLYILRERRLLILGVTLSLTLVAVLLSLLQTPVYRAEAVVELRPSRELGAPEDLETFLEEVRSAVVRNGMLQEVMREAGWRAESQAFRDRLDVETFVKQNGYSGLRVRFSGPDAEEAARAANAYASLFTRRVGRLSEHRLAGGTLAASARVREEAALPEDPASPSVLLRASVAAGVGLLLGTGVALLLESRARGWRGARDAEFVLRVPVLGTIPEYPSASEKIDP